MTPNKHEKALISLMDQAGIVVETTPAPYTIREGWDAAHYNFNVYSTKQRCGVHRTGLYSMGWGHFKASDLPLLHGMGPLQSVGFASSRSNGGDRNPPLDREEAFRLLTRGYSDSPVVWDIRCHVNNKRIPEPVQVFWSLLRDASGTDQDFTDWADELGYSDDSIKAKAIWEECNEIRRFLESIMPGEILAAMHDVANEI